VEKLLYCTISKKLYYCNSCRHTLVEFRAMIPPPRRTVPVTCRIRYLVGYETSSCRDSIPNDLKFYFFHFSYMQELRMAILRERGTDNPSLGGAAVPKTLPWLSVSEGCKAVPASGLNPQFHRTPCSVIIQQSYRKRWREARS
jgi:hypothetical protein